MDEFTAHPLFLTIHPEKKENEDFYDILQGTKEKRQKRQKESV